MDQWYVNAAKLAKPAIAAVGMAHKLCRNAGKTCLTGWKISIWCVSRHSGGGTGFGMVRSRWHALCRTDPANRRRAQAHYGKAVTLVQDEDVLDTWFSSALWPFQLLAGLKIRQSWLDIIREMYWLQDLTSFSSGLRG